MPDLPERLRVAVFTETFLPKIDGIVSVLQLMLQRLNEQGHQVILFGPEGGPEEFAGAEIVGVGGPKVFFYPELDFNYPRPWIYQRVKQFNPDVIHAVNPFVLGAFGLYCARRLDTPTLASYHTDMARYADHYGFGFTKPALWSYLRSMHNRADVNLCPSSAVRDELRAQGFRRVRWWKRGIDTDFFTPGPVDMAMRSRLSDGHPDDFLIVYVGRQSPEKGLFGLRDAIFPQEGVRLALIGGGPALEELKRTTPARPQSFPATYAAKNSSMPTARPMPSSSLPPPRPLVWSRWKLWPAACRSSLRRAAASLTPCATATTASISTPNILNRWANWCADCVRTRPCVMSWPPTP